MTAADLIEPAGYALLLAALLVPRLRHVRILLVLFALTGIARWWLIGGDSLTLSWPLALLTIGIVLYVNDVVSARAARLTPEETAMAARLLPGVPTVRARHLIDQGLWLNGHAGDVLTTEGEPVGHLYFLSEGEAAVISGDRQVATCRAGDLIGELTVLTGEPASATVTLSGPARFWCASAAQLRPYLAAHDEVSRVIERSISEALKSKLRASNRAVAQAGGLASV